MGFTKVHGRKVGGRESQNRCEQPRNTSLSDFAPLRPFSVLTINDVYLNVKHTQLEETKSECRRQSVDDGLEIRDTMCP